MSAIDPRIDDYIFNAADFAKPVLNHLRSVVHMACPPVRETIKWSFPHFEYEKSILCSMAAFKQHCAFHFWLGALLSDPKKIIKKDVEKNSMGDFGHIRSVSDLPSDEVLTAYLLEAMALIEDGKKQVKKAKPATPAGVDVPGYLNNALEQNAAAAAVFDKISPSNKKEYIEWLTEAKNEVTRMKRLAVAIEWLSEGKTRNWKYIRS